MVDKMNTSIIHFYIKKWPKFCGQLGAFRKKSGEKENVHRKSNGRQPTDFIPRAVNNGV